MTANLEDLMAELSEQRRALADHDLDIVERLRATGGFTYVKEAADEIERLRAEVERLRRLKRELTAAWHEAETGTPEGR
jgi:hypothetical protein